MRELEIEVLRPWIITCLKRFQSIKAITMHQGLNLIQHLITKLQTTPKHKHLIDAFHYPPFYELILNDIVTFLTKEKLIGKKNDLKFTIPTEVTNELIMASIWDKDVILDLPRKL